ncbi:competence type IV pilus assembly protein ComGB [Peribacillus sp. SI8-4]|uniref:competence type IV pilus assembly protein ComGB n=1 Tax=Peribacillus sp. SI8-4 TaxID=3048009 RepID=UPI0025530162|nr:competence type IV pilus assembly protein ComGB [Peribacillus sp. SI8-4]
MMTKSKWKLKEQAVFVTKLGELLSHGYPLAEAIHFLEFQESKKKAGDFTKALKDLRSGYPLHQVLSHLGFHPQLVSYIFYGEQYGDLDRALKEGGGYWKKRTEDLHKVKKVLVYPIFLVFFVSIVFYILQSVLLPKFQAIYITMNVDQNIILILLSALSFILPLLPFILIGMFLFLYLLRRLWFNRMCPLRQRRLLIGIPIVGSFIRLYETYFFASQFSGMLSGGLSINESINLFSINQQQPFYQKLCSIIKDDLTEGRSLEMIFQELPYFDRNLPVVAANGQKYGRLDAELLHYSQFLLEKMEEKMNVILKILQPLMFSVIGCLIVSIYLAVLLPMFSLLEGV